MKRVHEGRIDQLLREGNPDQIYEQDGRDDCANGAVNRRELLLLGVGQCPGVRVQVELLDTALGAGP